MGVAQPVNRSGGVDAGARGRLFDDKIDGTLGQWIPGLPNNTGADAGALPRLAKQAGGDHRGIGTSRLVLPLPAIESWCLPQPDSNLTAS
jgi:hypothetical protein